MDFAQEFKELQREIRELKTATPGSGGGQTPNDGILTLQQNGTTVQTFSANQATNATADFDIHNGVMTADNLSPTSDTASKWALLFPTSGTYITFYSTAGCFTNQPSQYGFLITKIHYYPSNAIEIHQSWNTTTDTTSPSLTRSGDSTGWHNSTGKFSQLAQHTEWNIAPTSDTVSAWRSFFPIDGIYTTFYSANKFNAQPQNWGIMTTEISNHPANNGFEIYQKWHSQSAGSDFFRAGNTTGWFGASGNAGAFRRNINSGDGPASPGTTVLATLGTSGKITSTGNITMTYSGFFIGKAVTFNSGAQAQICLSAPPSSNIEYCRHSIYSPHGKQSGCLLPSCSQESTALCENLRN